MGANYAEMYVSGGNETHVRKQFEARQENDAHEYGNSYSGELNMAPGLTFTGKKFKSHNEASEWILENAKKWDNALAVEYRDKEGSLRWLIGAICSC